jgi:hypothetical protein
MAEQSKATSILAVILLTWVTVAISGYYVFHHPFNELFMQRFVATASEISISFLLFAIAGGLGVRLLPTRKPSEITEWAIQGALGLGILSIGYLVVGWVLGTGIWIAWISAVGLAVWIRREIAIWLRNVMAFKKILADSDGLGRVVALLTAAILWFGLVRALAPPLKFDSLVYHLTLPELYVLQGRIAYVADIMYWGFPQLPHMLSTWVLAMGGKTGALIGWFAGFLCIAGIMGHVKERLGLRAAWVGVASLLSSYSLGTSLGWAYVDWPTMLMGWALIYYLEQWWAKSEIFDVLFAGVFAGFAFGAKYTAGILVPLGVFVMLLKNWRTARAGLVFLGAGLATAAPWLIKNLIATGNPFYPLIFPAGAMDELRLDYLVGFPVQGNWLDLVLLPFRVTWLGIEGGHIGQAPGYEASIGPVLLALVPLAFLRNRLVKKQKSLLVVASAIGLGGLLIWTVGVRFSGHLARTHLYYSIFPALSILCAYGFLAIENLKLPRIRTGRVVAVLIGLTLGLNVITVAIEALSSRSLQFLSGQLSEQDFLEHNLGPYASVSKYLKTEMQGDAHTVMLWETRGYYCVPLCEPDEVIDRWQHDLAVYGNPEAVFERWRAQGYTHVLYYQRAAEFVSEDPEHFHPIHLAELEETLGQLQLARDFNGIYLLYLLGQ